MLSQTATFPEHGKRALGFFRSPHPAVERSELEVEPPARVGWRCFQNGNGLCRTVQLREALRQVRSRLLIRRPGGRGGPQVGKRRGGFVHHEQDLAEQCRDDWAPRLFREGLLQQRGGFAEAALASLELCIVRQRCGGAAAAFDSASVMLLGLLEVACLLPQVRLSLRDEWRRRRDLGELTESPLGETLGADEGGVRIFRSLCVVEAAGKVALFAARSRDAAVRRTALPRLLKRLGSLPVLLAPELQEPERDIGFGPSGFFGDGVMQPRILGVVRLLCRDESEEVGTVRVTGELLRQPGAEQAGGVREMEECFGIRWGEPQLLAETGNRARVIAHCGIRPPQVVVDLGVSRPDGGVAFERRDRLGETFEVEERGSAAQVCRDQRFVVAQREIEMCQCALVVPLRSENESEVQFGRAPSGPDPENLAIGRRRGGQVFRRFGSARLFEERAEALRRLLSQAERPRANRGQRSNQNMNFNPICIVRAEPAEKIWPVLTRPIVVTGLPRLTWLVELNISQRNCTNFFSVT